MKIILLVMSLALLIGCAHIKESDWLNHDTQYASWEHARFSLWGYRSPTAEDARLSKEQGWWGKPVKIKPQNKQIWNRQLSPKQRR